MEANATAYTAALRFLQRVPAPAPRRSLPLDVRFGGAANQPDGTFSGFIGSAVDITDQKQAQEALEKLSGKLIDAQEQERSRIARELHDDISQRLALLSLEPGAGVLGFAIFRILTGMHA